MFFSFSYMRHFALCLRVAPVQKLGDNHVPSNRRRQTGQ